MKGLIWFVMTVALCGGGVSARAATVAKDETPKAGVEAARAISKVTGIAISPLLGTGAVGAWDYFKTPKARRDKLPWYSSPFFWVPTLLLVGAVAAKDAFGAALPPGWKKPLDVAETIENKVSGLVAAGAVVPALAMIFHSSSSGSAVLPNSHWAGSGFAAISFAPLLNVLTVPLAMAAFVLVWFTSHAIHVLILISPFGAVDAALKAARTALLGLVTVTSFTNPWAGAVLSLIIILISYFLAGWSFRLSVFGSVYIWDFVTIRKSRFSPAPNANWMFTACEIEQTPIRTYGKLVRGDDGQLTFAYRPWLVLKQQTLTMPQGTYAVGCGLFYPEIMLVDGENEQTLLILPPRYKTHEAAVAKACGLTKFRDVGVLKGFKAIWHWLKNLFGGGVETEAASAGAAQ